MSLVNHYADARILGPLCGAKESAEDGVTFQVEWVDCDDCLRRVPRYRVQVNLGPSATSVEVRAFSPEKAEEIGTEEAVTKLCNELKREMQVRVLPCD